MIIITLIIIFAAAGCSIQNIFATPFHQRLNAYRKLLLWADGSFSDLIAHLNLYQVRNIEYYLVMLIKRIICSTVLGTSKFNTYKSYIGADGVFWILLQHCMVS